MQFKHRMIAPVPALAASVHTFYVIETDAVHTDEVMPAYSAQIVVAVRGRVRISFADRRAVYGDRITINAPQLRSAACVLEGPATLVGASLTPRGWQELSNLPADTVHDRLVPASTVLDQAQIAAIEGSAVACEQGRAAPEDVVGQLGAVIADAPFSLRPDQITVLEEITRWLGSGFDPPLADLHAATGLSPRQLQRLCRRYFGVAPAQTLKRHRAIRAAMLLANPALSEALRARMFATYFDQPHLIRDIRRYTGHTPKLLRVPSLSNTLLDPVGHGDTARFLRSHSR